MVSVKKDHASPPALVTESWRRIEAWLAKRLPAVRASLRPGVSKRDLNTFEKALGRALPEDVRESWLIHDGQGQPPDEFYATARGKIPESLGLLYGFDLNPLTSKKGLAPSPVLGQWSWSWTGPKVNPFTKEKWVPPPKPALEWASWAKGATEETGPGDRTGSGEGPPSFPPGAVRRCDVHVGWLPMATLVDADFLGIDLAPGPKGVVGQVITYGAASDEHYVLAASWAQFLEDFADELEAGNFVIDLKRMCSEFQMKEPDYFHMSYGAWSQAKLPPDFPRRAASL